jgi:hypothetical protein
VATRSRLPAHFSMDGTEHAARLIRQMGLPDSRVTELWRAERRGTDREESGM